MFRNIDEKNGEEYENIYRKNTPKLIVLKSTSKTNVHTCKILKKDKKT